MPLCTSRTSIILLLILLEALAIYTLWVQMYLNNHATLMASLCDYGSHLLPGTSIPLKKEYTGIEAVDRLLTVLVLSFAVVIDGSRMESTLFAVGFGGVVGVVVLIMWIESIRIGSGYSFIRYPTIWGLAIQVLGFGIVMPIWCISHLLSSSTIKPSPQQLSSLKRLPLSMTIGYLIPTVLMFLPRFSNSIDQNLIAFWQPFPLWISAIHFLLGYLPFYASSTVLDSSTEDLKGQEQEALKSIFNFGTDLARIPHVISLFSITLASVFPSTLEWSTESQTPGVAFENAYIAPNPINPVNVEGIAHGMHVFLLWDFYISSAAVLIWGAWLRFNQGYISGRKKWVEKLPRVMWMLFVGGAGAIVIDLMKKRHLENVENVDTDHTEQKSK